MCDSDSTYTSDHSIYLDASDSDLTDASLAWAICETLVNKPRRPRFDYLMWLRYGYINFKRLIQLKREAEIDQGIWFPKWTLRSKNSFV